MAIKLYWSGGGRGEINFGDTISPLIVEMMAGKAVTYADIKHCDMTAIGSLLGKVCKRTWKRVFGLRLDPIKVWGTGAFSEEDLGQKPFLKCFAVRGPKTQKAMSLPAALPLGDPGLLINRLAAPKIAPIRWGIIPHMSELAMPCFQRFQTETKNSAIIDLTTPDIKDTLSAIQACDFILSTSLHGLITADALGIPNIWLRARDHYHTSDWKYLDYFASVGRAETAPLAADTLAGDLSALERSAQAADPAQVAARQAELEQAFAAMNV